MVGTWEHCGNMSGNTFSLVATPKIDLVPMFPPIRCSNKVQVVCTLFRSQKRCASCLFCNGVQNSGNSGNSGNSDQKLASLCQKTCSHWCSHRVPTGSPRGGNVVPRRHNPSSVVGGGGDQ